MNLSNTAFVNHVQSRYLTWVNNTEYLIMVEYDPLKGYLDHVAVKASKRGNDVYASRVKDRIKPLVELPDTSFFNYKDRSSGHETSAIFFTSSYDPKGKTLIEAWESVGEDWNRFITALRARFGDIQVYRCYEAHIGRRENLYAHRGYPHIHAMLVFKDHKFKTFFHNGKWRIQGKRDIEGLWKHGFIDIQGVSSTREGFKYLGKYLGKLQRLDSTAKYKNASLITLSMLWIFRKRAYSVSKSLLDLIVALHNSNPREYFELIQLDLEGCAPPVRVTQWILCGFFAGELIKGGKVRWSVGLNNGEFKRISGSSSYRNRLGIDVAYGWCEIECAVVPRDIGFIKS